MVGSLTVLAARLPNPLPSHITLRNLLLLLLRVIRNHGTPLVQQDLQGATSS